MKISLRPSVPFTGTLSALSGEGEATITPVNKVVERLQRSSGLVLRQGAYDLVVEIEPEGITQMMSDLEGWTAQPVLNTVGTSAFEGMLTFHLDRD